MMICNKRERENQNKLYKQKRTEEVYELLRYKEPSLHKFMGLVDYIAEENARMFEYFDTLAILSHMMFTDGGSVKEEIKPFITRPAFKLAIEKLCRVHGGLVCGPFGTDLEKQIEAVDTSIGRGSIQLSYPESYWEKRKEEK